MRVQFLATLDEVVEATQRGLERSAVVRGRRWKNVIVAGLFSGVVAFVITRVSAASPLATIVMTVLGVMIGVASQKFSERNTTESRLREVCLEYLGTDEPIEVQVELTPEGVSTEQQGTEVKFTWASIEEIEDTPEAITFFRRHGGLIVVQRCAFKSAEERRQFLELAARYRAQPQSFAEPIANS